MGEPNKELSDALLSTKDDIWGERASSRYEQKIMGDSSFSIGHHEAHSRLPALIGIMVVLAVIVAAIYGIAEAWK